MTMKRRDFLVSTGAVAATSLLAGCTQEDGTGSGSSLQVDTPPPVVPETSTASIDPELINDFLAESFVEPDAFSGPVGETVTSLRDLADNPDLFEQVKNVVQLVADKTITAAEMADEDSVDYAHLVTSSALGDAATFDETPFELNAETLKSIAATNAYVFDEGAQPVVLFGLRGCVLTSGTSAKGQSVELKEAKIDHVSRRCVVGAWDRNTDELSLFEGSTVPNLVNMQLHLFWKYAQDPLNDAEWPFAAAALSNQLPQGLHEYTVGTHLRNSKPSRRHPGAFLQRSPSPVLRAQNDLSYSFAENWDPLDWQPDPGKSDRNVRVTANNIHAAVNKYFPGYASQGCQTIQGYYEPRGETPVGAWSHFQQAVGIAIIAVDGAFKSNLDDQGLRYKYMLTTGREARLHATAGAESGIQQALKRLRIGSRGPAVVALRAMLELPVDRDVFDAETMNELLRWQSSRMPKDGLVSPDMIASQGLNIEL